MFAALVVVLLASCNNKAAKENTPAETTDSTATKVVTDSTATTTVSE